jgi:hypothetical protein
MNIVVGKGIVFGGDFDIMLTEEQKKYVGTSPVRLLSLLSHSPNAEAPKMHQAPQGGETNVKETEEDAAKPQPMLTPDQIKEYIKRAQRGEEIELPKPPPPTNEKKQETQPPVTPIKEVSEENPLNDECAGGAAKPKVASPDDIIKAIRSGKMPPNI